MVNKKIILTLVLILSILSALVLAEAWAPVPPDTSEEQPPQIRYDNTLKIIEITTSVDGKKDTITNSGEKIAEEAKEKSDLKFEIKVKNTFGKEIRNIEVIVRIEDIDNGNDLKEESDISKLSSGSSEKVNLDFNLPLKVDDGRYDVKIDVKGKDENNSLHIANWALKLEVKKEKNNVAITEASIYPSTISCYRQLNLEIRILNLGRNEEEIKIEIKNDALGINIKEENIKLGEGTDDDAEYEKTFGLKIPQNIKKGIYPIKIKVYYNKGRFVKTTDLNLIIEDCKQIKQKETILIKSLPDQKETIGTAKQKSQIQSIIYTYEEPIILFSIIILIILIGLIIFLMGAIIIKLRR